jgi:hypothetical protein
VIYHSTQTSELAKLDARLDNHANKLQESIEKKEESGKILLVEKLSSIQTDGLKEIRFRLVDKNGTFVLGDSSLIGLSIPPWPLREHLPPRREYLTMNEHTYRSIWVPVDVRHSVVYDLQLVAPMTEMETNL